jgi:hypothetical protein
VSTAIGIVAAVIGLLLLVVLFGLPFMGSDNDRDFHK